MVKAYKRSVGVFFDMLWLAFLITVAFLGFKTVYLAGLETWGDKIISTAAGICAASAVFAGHLVGSKKVKNKELVKEA